MANDNGHPDEATWDQLSSGELDAAARDAVFDHIVACERCSRIWRGVLTLKSEAQAQGLMPPDVAVSRAWLRSPGLQLALAATLVVVVGGVLVNRRPAVVAPVTSEPVTNAAPIAAPPSAAVPAAWLAAFPLSKADIHVTPEEALAPRGVTAATGEPPIDRLAAALEPYRRDDFQAAAATLAELYRAFPAASRTALYLGVSLLHVNRDTDALAPLRSATLSKQPEVAADAHWYLSVALARTGQTQAAASELAPLCRAGGTGAARACAALTALTQSQP